MGEPLAVIITIEAREGRDESAAFDHGYKELKGALGVLNHSSPWAVFGVAEGEDEEVDEQVAENLSEADLADEAGDSTPDPDDEGDDDDDDAAAEDDDS